MEISYEIKYFDSYIQSGGQAVKRVNELLPYLSENVDLFVSNNASDKFREEYDGLKDIKSEYFHYSENEENLFFVGNLIKLIMEADGDYCLITSDEDSVIGENIESYLALLNESKNIVFIRTCTIKNYVLTENEIASPGMEAMRLIWQKNNYISGTIYNLKFLRSKILSIHNYFSSTGIDRNEAYFYYPHLFYDAYLATQGICIFCKIPLISENEPDAVEEAERREKNNGDCIPGYEYTSYDSRIKQFAGFVEYIKVLETDYDVKLEMLMILIAKYIDLINNLRQTYEEMGRDFNDIRIMMNKDMKRMIRGSSIIEDINMLQLFESMIDELIGL